MIAEITKSAHTPQLIFGGVCALFMLSVMFLFPHTTHAEYIESFVSDISVHKDSTFDVAENISYVFDVEKHGIFRCIPTLHQEKASSFLKERYIDIEVESVQMDDADVPYDTDEKDDELCIKIGDPDKSIIGTHKYSIAYTIAGAISYPPFGGAELYYNVTGNEWKVRIQDVETRVSSPDGIMLRERACYRGTEGNMNSCKSVTEKNGIVYFKDSFLNPGEGVTIAQALNRSVIQMDVRERYTLLDLIPVLLVISSIVFGILIYRYKTKFKNQPNA